MTIRPVCYIVLGLGMWLSTGCSSHEDDGLGTTVSAAESDEAKDKKPASDTKKHAKFTNRLSRETSPYLLMHSHNPVDWYAWGPEAFEKAEKEGKMIFLSIGYSSCYWCHVMERKVFENEEIAKYMNKHFVNIKVDREERPDVDDIYMTALQVMRRSGGWPLSMFLTPDGKPLIGGTYFPPYDLENRQGFSTIMKLVVDLWGKDRKELEKHASLMTEQLQLIMKPRLTLKPPELKRSIVNNVIGELTSSYDSQYGGVDFNSSQPNRPKFPVPSKLSLLQYAILQNGDSKAEQVVAHTLESIAAGGIHDHLGGGFHRYSTDRAWMVPHFEKMLYDNAQLAVVYVEAFRQTGKPVYRHAAENIFTFVKNEMTHSDGGFFSAMDAETNAIEGESYLWTKREIDKILGVEDSKLFQTVYGLEAKKYFEHGYILHLPDPIETVAEKLKLDPTELSKKLAVMRPKLLAVRKKRDQPFLDDKVLTSWNGLMIRAYANAGTVFKRDEYIAAAAKAATFLLTHLRDDQGRLLRTYRAETAKLNAYLDDYAFLVEGLLALYDATKNEEWLKHARELVDQQIKLFWDDKGKGFYFTSHHHEALLARTKNAYDSVIPSGNSVSARNLIRLATITGESKYRDFAKEILFLFVPRVEEIPRGMTNMSLALGEFLDSESKDKPATKPAKAETSKPAVEETKKKQADKTIDKK